MNHKWLAELVLGLIMVIDVSAVEAQGTIQYIVMVKTSACDDAGTDANVTLRLCGREQYGRLVCTASYLLDNPGCDDFGIGSTEIRSMFEAIMIS